MSIAPPAPPPTDTKLTRREWGLLLLLSAVNCTEVTDALLLSPLAKKLQSAEGGLGLSTSEYLYSAGVYGFAAAVCGLLASVFVDRFCRKRLVACGFALAAAGLSFVVRPQGERPA